MTYITPLSDSSTAPRRLSLSLSLSFFSHTIPSLAHVYATLCNFFLSVPPYLGTNTPYTCTVYYEYILHRTRTRQS